MSHAAAEPNLDHPLVEIACRLLQPDPELKWTIDDEGVDFLTRAVLSQKADPGLPAAILGLFHVATDLHRAHDAPAAAGRIFAMLGVLGSMLFKQGEVAQEVFDTIEAARDAFTQLGQSRSLPLEYGAAAPSGTISARTLMLEPVRPRMPVKGRRAPRKK